MTLNRLDKPVIQPRIPVQQLLDGLGEQALQVLAGKEGLDRQLDRPRIQKPGLALAGFLTYINPGRVQILGNSEITFLKTMEADRRQEICDQVMASGVSCFVITKGLEPPEELKNAADKFKVPLLVTPIGTSQAITKILEYLEDVLAPKTYLHGVMVDVFGMGVFLIGTSGIGKSECALDLITRGHRLVADDLVEFRRKGKNVIGYPSSVLPHFMEVRGLGLISIKHLFGVSSIRYSKTLDLLIELELWAEGAVYDRLGFEQTTVDVLETPTPYIKIPVGPGRNVSMLIEVSARNLMLHKQGINPVQSEVGKLEQKIREEGTS